MSATTDLAGGAGDALDDIFDCLADAHRRRLVGELYGGDAEGASLDELATLLAAWRRGQPPESVADDHRREALAELHHVHLPKLEGAGLVERTDDGRVVSVADHPAYRDEGVREALDDGDEDLDALFGALSTARRRVVLDVLSHQFQPIRLETLAREVGAYDRDVSERDVPPEAVERVLVTLHHRDVPKLSAAGLVDHDADRGTVAYEGHPRLRVPWMHSVLAPDFRRSLTGESDTDGVGTIDDREKVVSFGQSLCDRADEELFCLFTETGLLEAGCLTRIRDASRRGVDVYLGTCNPTVRDYVREQAPDVEVWEPDADWLNFPVEDGRVGRLLLADREAVMLATLGEEGDDGVHEERALVGEGADNALVVLLRQTLGPRLDSPEADVEDVPARLPF